jgi:hypothetical protein
MDERSGICTILELHTMDLVKAKETRRQEEWGASDKACINVVGKTRSNLEPRSARLKRATTMLRQQPWAIGSAMEKKHKRREGE